MESTYNSQDARSERHPRPGLATLDLSEGAAREIKLDGEVVIDARVHPVHGWKEHVDKVADTKYRGTLNSIRRAVVSCYRYEKEPGELSGELAKRAFVESMRFWGFGNTKNAEIIDGIPGDWYREKDNPEVYYQRGEWEQIKERLLSEPIESAEEKPKIPQGLVVLDLRSSAESVVTLGGKVVIDARPKKDPRLPSGFINREEWRKIGLVSDAVRDIVVNSLHYQEDPKVMSDLIGRALIKVMRDLGYKADAAKVKGGVPENWKPDVGIAHRWVKKPQEWETIKEELMALV